MPITINDIQKIEKTKKEIKKEIYKKIYEQFSKKIKNSVSVGQKQVCLRIPSFLMGYPSYDMKKAGDYIQRQFENSGFVVHRMTEIDIYVSWCIQQKRKKKEFSSHQVNFSSEVEDDSLPSLINLKKLATKYKNA